MVVEFNDLGLHFSVLNGYLTDLLHTTLVFLKLMEHMYKGKKKPREKEGKGGSGGEGAKSVENEEIRRGMG